MTSLQFDDFVPRWSFGRRLEPEADRVLHGAGQDPDAFREYWRAVGEGLRPALYMTYVNLARDLDGYFDRLAAELAEYEPYRLVPQIGLTLTGGADDEHHPEQHYEDAVAEGRYDAEIEELCRGLRALGRPAYLRIGFEFNGPWFGYRPEPYKAAWVRVVSAPRARLRAGLPQRAPHPVALPQERRAGGGRARRHHEPPRALDHRLAARQRRGADDLAGTAAVARPPVAVVDFALREGVGPPGGDLLRRGPPLRAEHAPRRGAGRPRRRHLRRGRGGRAMAVLRPGPRVLHLRLLRQVPAPDGLRQVLFYRPKGSSQAQMLEAKANLLRLKQDVPLTDDERAAVDDGVSALETLCARLADVPTPAGPTPREMTSDPAATSDRPAGGADRSSRLR